MKRNYYHHITSASLSQETAELHYLFLLPKIHKKNNPGRPIVSACDSPTEKKSIYVDSYLQPLAVKIDSYIKDTTDFLHKLTEMGQLHKDSTLLTIDVVSLYTNIPLKDGIRATKQALDTRSENLGSA